MAPMPPPRCELSSLITAATKPQEIPVAQPSTAARRDRDMPGGLPGPKATASARKGAHPPRHPRRAQPVPPPHPHPAADDGHVAEDEQQLQRQDGLDQR